MPDGYFGTLFAGPAWLTLVTTKPDRPHPLIRRFGLQDVDRIHEIEKLAYPFPWSRGLFEDCLNAGYACFGLQMGKQLSGYTVFNWAAGEAHLLNLCVHPDWQHRGYGSLLLEYMINHVAGLECDSLFLEVRASNEHAANLYKNRGFKVIGTRLSYYRAGEEREDAIVMALKLGSIGDD
jgi:ribosomal-protein-alanine N-acetyltransferase